LELELAQPADVSAAVTSAIHRVLAESGRPVREFAHDDVLTDNIGLDSLDLAIVVVQLERQLGVDPFRKEAAPVPTFGAMVALYEAECAKTK
jgi:acyl carrier protein